MAYPQETPQETPQAPRPQSAMESHAATLTALSHRLSVLTNRADNLITRIAGPQPPQAGEVAGTKEPAGVLHVAAFEAERMRQQIDALEAAFQRLEEFA